MISRVRLSGRGGHAMLSYMFGALFIAITIHLIAG
jgi:hypothetical protein